MLPLQDLTRCAPCPDQHQFTVARDVTAALTAQIQKTESEVDARVTAVQGV